MIGVRFVGVALPIVVLTACHSSPRVEDPYYCPAHAAAAPVADPTLLDPQAGIGGIVIGKSTADDVLRVFGCDAKVTWSGAGINRHILDISYDYDEHGEYLPGRGRNTNRPNDFSFYKNKEAVQFVSQIEVAAYNSGVHTPKGNTVKSPYESFVAEFGTPVVEPAHGAITLAKSTFPNGLIVWWQPGPTNINSMDLGSQD